MCECSGGRTWGAADVVDEVVPRPDAEVAADGARDAGAVRLVRQPPAVRAPEDILQAARAVCAHACMCMYLQRTKAGHATSHQNPYTRPCTLCAYAVCMHVDVCMPAEP